MTNRELLNRHCEDERSEDAAISQCHCERVKRAWQSSHTFFWIASSGFRPPRNDGKIAFTLAEVLITLGVIGVVAAMTMPTLMANHRKHVAETKLAKFYSVVNQAIKMSTTVNEETENWEVLGENTNYEELNNWFMKYLAPYIKYTKIVEETTESGIQYLYIYLADSTVMRLKVGSADILAYLEQDCLKKSNCIIGTNIFMFKFWPTFDITKYPENKRELYRYIKSSDMQPYPVSWDGTEENAKQGCMQNGYLCTKLIQMNGWKIPKDYPIKF